MKHKVYQLMFQKIKRNNKNQFMNKKVFTDSNFQLRGHNSVVQSQFRSSYHYATEQHVFIQYRDIYYYLNYKRKL
jgi:hypothetical protein